MTESTTPSSTAILAPTVLPVSSQVHPIVCTRTGLLVASITVIKVAGHVPYLSQWKHTQALHPVFSLEQTALLQFARSTWHSFCNLSQDEAANIAITNKQEQLLRVTALAILHQMAEVDQSIHWMPTLQEVYVNWTSLMQLSYWKNYLESKRFKFPNLRISKNNNGIELTAYIQDCWAVKKAYETKIIEAEELEKARAAELALKAIKDEVAGKTPRSKKLLWRWFLAHIPSRYARDTEGWMWELFDAETEAEVSEFTMADIDLFEEIFLCEVPTGSSISAAFLEKLKTKRSLLESKFHTFEIMIPDTIAAGIADGSISSVMPTIADFAGNKIKFLIAMAKWKLANASPNATKHRDAAMAKQSSITVNPTFIPDIGEFITADDAGSDSNVAEDLAAGFIIVDDDKITGDKEDN
jgi:hypothetical protein